MGRLRDRLQLQPARQAARKPPRVDPEGISMGSSTRPNSTKLQGNNYNVMEAKISKIVDEFLQPCRLDPEKYEKTRHQLSNILDRKRNDIYKRSAVEITADCLQESFIVSSQTLADSRENADVITTTVTTDSVQASKESSSSRSNSPSDENLNASDISSVTVTDSASESVSSRSRSAPSNGDYATFQLPEQTTSEERFDDSSEIVVLSKARLLNFTVIKVHYNI